MGYPHPNFCLCASLGSYLRVAFEGVSIRNTIRGVV